MQNSKLKDLRNLLAEFIPECESYQDYETAELTKRFIAMVDNTGSNPKKPAAHPQPAKKVIPIGNNLFDLSRYFNEFTGEAQLCFNSDVVLSFWQIRKIRRLMRELHMSNFRRVSTYHFVADIPGCKDHKDEVVELLNGMKKIFGL